MIIDTKYNVGDKVKYIRHRYERKRMPCGFCDGSGEITGRNGEVRDCPDCNGDGYFWDDVRTKEEVVGTIAEVVISYDSSVYPYCETGPAIDFAIDKAAIIRVPLQDIISLQ